MLTADTITDEQIRELYADGTLSGPEVHVATRRYFIDFGDEDPARTKARAYCADILNQRGGAK